jgi:hypothetical protein
LTRDPDLLTITAGLMFSVQEELAKLCGEPTGLDKALLLIGRRHQGVAQ